MLFAQQGQFGGAAGGDDKSLAVLILGFVCGFLLVVLLVVVLFLLSLSKCLAKCARRNRSIQPGQVWLNLIPCFNIVWQFITVVRVTQTLKDEFEARGERRGDDSFGQGVGLAALVLNLVSNAVSRVGTAVDKANNNATDFNPFDIIALGLAVVALVCFIIYWVKIVGYSRELDADPDYDDRPRRRRDDDGDDDRLRSRNRDDDRGDRDDEDDDRPSRRRRRGDDDDR